MEINSSFYHLVDLFLSRFGQAGGRIGPQTIENRSRFYCDIIREIKRRCGRVPVATTSNPGEFGLRDGITLRRRRPLPRTWKRRERTSPK